MSFLEFESCLYWSMCGLLTSWLDTPCRWLRQRAHGIRLLEYTPGPPFETYRAQATSEFQRKQQIIIDVLPQLTALLSSEAEIHLDLRYGETQLLIHALWLAGLLCSMGIFVLSGLTRLLLLHAMGIYIARQHFFPKDFFGVLVACCARITFCANKRSGYSQRVP